MSDSVRPDPLGDVAAALRNGARRPVSYAETLCERIEAVDPDVRAFVGSVERDRATAAAAAVADAREPWDRPPLYGVPVGAKDIFNADGFPTRGGSTLPPSVLTGPEASAVARLREAGAYVLGKTVTTEFAFFAPGPTRNPHDLGRTPGGSSSGSAAAVAAGEVPLALGTQTVGSVIRPAAFCGVVGYKPSHGRIPLDGVIPFSPAVDHVGTFAADVAGTRLVASVLCDGWDATAAAADARPVVGVPEGDYLERAGETGRAAFEAAVDALAERLEVRRFDLETAGAYEHHRPLIAAEFALTHADWYETYGDRYAPESRDLVEEGRATDVAALAAGRRSRGAFRGRVEARMAEAGADLLACPAAPGPAPEGIDDTGDPRMNLPWTHGGLPVLGLPAGRVDGLPVGVQFVAPHGADEALLAAARDLEAALPGGELDVA